MSQKTICVALVSRRLRFHVSAALSSIASSFDPGGRFRVRRQHPGVEGELAAVGGDGQRVVLARVHASPLRMRSYLSTSVCWIASCSLGHRAGDDLGLPAFERRAGQVEHVGRLHVGELTEHLLQLRQVHELGEPGPRFQSLPVGADLHRLDDLAEGGGPAIEVLDPARGQAVRVEEALERVEFDQGVRDRRAVGEGDAVAGVLLVQVAGLHQHVERAFTDPPAGMPATRSILVGVSRFFTAAASS